MNHIKITFVCILLALGCEASGQQKPNVVLMVVDDMGWTDLNCYGSSFYETPNIDLLAKSGMKFTDAYSACTVCSPSRASIMTGKSPARLRITDWITGHDVPYAKFLPPDWTQFLPLKEKTIAEVLKEQGYTTASIGKWHLGDDIIYYPEKQGFDLNIAGTYQGQPPSYFSPYNIPRLKDGPEGEYLTDRLTIEAEKFITDKKAQPFLLYMPFYGVHTPLQARKSEVEYFRSKIVPGANHINPTYAAMIKSVDESVGRIIALINKLGIAENTLIIFTSDNGGLIGGRNNINNRITSNVPLRMGKGSNYEGGTRVPAIFSWRGKIKSGSVSDVPIIGTDLFPTLAALGRAPITKAQNIDGVNILPLLTGSGKLNRKALFWHYPHYHPEGGTPHSAIRQGDWKLIYSYETGSKELYNLKNDIGETNNMVLKESALAAVMYERLVKWKKKVSAQDPRPNPDYNEQKKTSPGKVETRIIKDPHNLN
ncbi:MAG: sulfatase [Daejeonella sp.]